MSICGILVSSASTVQLRHQNHFEKQILVNKKHKMKILQYDSVVNHADNGKLIMVNSLEIGTEKTLN